MKKERCKCAEPDGFYLDVWGEECCKKCGNAMPNEVSSLRASVARLTKENEELRKFREDVIAVQSAIDLDHDDPPYDAETMMMDYRLRAAAIRERSKR